MRKLIILLIRTKHKLKKNECFRFSNQKSSNNFYYFTEDELKKVDFDQIPVKTIRANVSLNWLLDNRCEIVRIK